ncbi:hypothetical protein SALBM311S_00519 [Streptomyces alboniger]
MAAGAASDSVTAGSDGRYMSIASGGVAVRPPRTRVTRKPVRRRPGGGGPAAPVAPGTDDGFGAVPVCATADCDSCGVDAPRSGMRPSLSG